MNNENLENSAKACDQDAFTQSPLRSMLGLIGNLPTTTNQQIRRVCEESRRSEDALMGAAKMAGALHGEVGVALAYRKGGLFPRLK